MDSILIFMAGSVFTLLIMALCFLITFRIHRYNEQEVPTNRPIKPARKRPEVAVAEDGSGVLLPKTDEEKRLEGDETNKAFLDMLNNS